MMKLLVTLLLLLGCSRSSPLAEPEDYQYDESDSDLEQEETGSDDIDIQIISRPNQVQGKIGEKVVLPCRVEPEGLDPSYVNRVWNRPDTENNQLLAIGDTIMHNQQEFAVEGSNFIILKVAEKHVGQYRCSVGSQSVSQVTHSLSLKLAEDSSSSERIISNNSSILGHSLYLFLLFLLLL